MKLVGVEDRHNHRIGHAWDLALTGAQELGVALLGNRHEVPVERTGTLPEVIGDGIDDETVEGKVTDLAAFVLVEDCYRAAHGSARASAR
ncbi:MAG: hypothetical protein KC457_24345, partial [Myxococcales bacterium]|nr:hypothetical protein [Myxococcales bacterium]